MRIAPVLLITPSAVAAALCLSLLAACTREPSAEPAVAAPALAPAPPAPAANAPADDPDVAPAEGIFAGTLPRDGCEEALAVDATLHLRADGGFELIERQTAGGETIEHAGVWYASDDGRAILLADDHGHGHRVFEWHGDDALRLLPDAPPVDDADPVLLVRAD